MKKPIQNYLSHRSAYAKISWLAVLFSVSCLPVSGRTSEQAPTTDGSRPVVWQLDTSQPALEPEPLGEALFDAVREVAHRAGAVVCYEHDPASLDPAFSSLCRQRPTERHTFDLRWESEVEVRDQNEDRQTVTATLSMAVVSTDTSRKKKKRRKTHHLPPPKSLILQSTFELPTGVDQPSTHRTAENVYQLVASNRQLFDWFAGFSAHEDLLYPRPAGDFGPVFVSRFVHREEPRPEISGSAEERPPVFDARWEEQRRALVDSMLDGNFDIAQMRAEEMLEDPDLPESLAQRIAELRARSIEQLDDAEDEDTVATTGKEFDVTFQVRFARPGQSFRSGSEGKLRISTRDIRFVPTQGPGRGWSIAWPSLATADEAAGIWDVAYPLVLETKDGEKYFLTEMTPEGRFGSGRQILQFLEKGRRLHG